MIDAIRGWFGEISLVYCIGERRHWNQEVQLKSYLKNNLFSDRERERESTCEQTPWALFMMARMPS